MKPSVGTHPVGSRPPERGGSTSPRGKRGPRLRFRAVVAALLAVLPARAERLPIRVYRVPDGLADDGVRRIVRDSRGFLWLCTRLGLSRFDGSAFANYGVASGLPDGPVFDLLETRTGEYLAATGEGVYRLDPTAPDPCFFRVPFPSDPPPSIVDVAEDAAGKVWAGGEGLFLLEPSDRGWVGAPAEGSADLRVETLLAARDGGVWIGTDEQGLILRDGGAAARRYTTEDGLPSDRALSLLEDRRGLLWVGTTRGLAAFRAGGAGGLLRIVSFADENPPWRAWVRALVEAPDGDLWAATTEEGFARIELLEEGASPRWRILRHTGDSPQAHVTALALDTEGNLWAGTESVGAFRVAWDGLSSWSEPEGLLNPRTTGLVQDAAGEVLAVTADHLLHRLHGGPPATVSLRVPASALAWHWGWNRVLLQDHRGEWWVPTWEGLYRFPAVRGVEGLARARPIARYTTADGLGADRVFVIYEDRRGDLWISTEGEVTVTRWERSAGRFRRFGPAEGLPDSGPIDFQEDRDGNVWAGFYGGGVGRFDAGRRRFDLFGAEEGCPPGQVRDLHLDRKGRLWIASSRGGVGLVEDPSTPRPRIGRLTTTDGLSSPFVSCIAEDGAGRLYFGTSRGVDRFDPENRRWRHYTTEDGLPNSFVNVALTDRHGALWFGTLGGVARLVPGLEPPRRPAPALIGSIRVGGATRWISRLGELRPPPLELRHDAGSIEIAVHGVAFRAGDRLRFQYRLEGADVDWGEPVPERTVRYPSLFPGRYRLLVRAVDGDGVASAEPAAVALEILAPVWRRPWFQAASAILLGTAVVAAVRNRERLHRRRRRELERVVGERTRELAAANASLEDAKRTLERRVEEGIAALRDAERMAAYGRLVAGVAHEVRHPVFALRNIGYVLTRKLRDRPDLERQMTTLELITERMGHLMDDLLAFARPPALSLEPVDPGALLDEALSTYRAEHGDGGPEAARAAAPGLPAALVDRHRIVQVLANLMENARKHATGATRVELRADVRGASLVLEVCDDGAGIPPAHLPRIFDPFYTTGKGSGLGLAIVKRVVQDHGGSIAVASAPGAGTVFTMTLPLAGPPAGGPTEAP
jgi:signal transduction histidine kinase/ligand-binding sensor domain-containing protein